MKKFDPIRPVDEPEDNSGDEICIACDLAFWACECSDRDKRAVMRVARACSLRSCPESHLRRVKERVKQRQFNRIFG